MEIFISWSGRRSGAVARSLHKWLPKVVNAFHPWLSSSDIDKGSRWGVDVATKLEAAKAGIICLAPENLHSDWILFEAGALSKMLKDSYVCTLLVGVETSDVSFPLAQFQNTKAEKADILGLVHTLNGVLGEGALQEKHIEEAFEVWWPLLEKDLGSLPPATEKQAPKRPDRELIEEVLDLLRTQNRQPIDLSTRVSDMRVGAGPLGSYTNPNTQRVHTAIMGTLTNLDSSLVMDHVTFRSWIPVIDILAKFKDGRIFSLKLPSDIKVETIPWKIMEAFKVWPAREMTDQNEKSIDFGSESS